MILLYLILGWEGISNKINWCITPSTPHLPAPSSREHKVPPFWDSNHKEQPSRLNPRTSRLQCQKAFAPDRHHCPNHSGQEPLQKIWVKPRTWRLWEQVAHLSTSPFRQDGVKRSISLRFIDYNKTTPGPQDYKVEGSKILNKAPAFTLGNRSKSARQIDLDHNSYKPGPTVYDAKKQTGMHGPFIGSSQRRDLTETEKTPAPSHYISEAAADFNSIANPRCKIGGEFRNTEFGQGEKTPGPALYNKSTFV